MSSHPQDIVDRLFSAIETNDISEIERLYADDFRIWHSFDGREKSKAENLAMIANSVGAGRRRYRVLERLLHGHRVAQRLELTVTPADGAGEYRMSLAIFLTIAGDRIATIDEYIDSRDAMAFMSMTEAGRRSGAIAPPGAGASSDHAAAARVRA